MDVKTQLRILHLEDNPLDSELVEEILASEGIACDIVRVETREDFEEALEEGGFDLIYSDKTLPSFDGLAALALAREKRPDVPFIFVSGTLGEEVAIESLKNGATDYVVKQRLKRIVPVTRRALREAADHLERKKAEDALTHERHLLHSLMDTVPDSIYFKDTEGKFTLINRDLANDLGLADTQEAVGKSDADFFSESLAAYSYRDEQEIMRTRVPILGKEEWEVWPDGRETWILTTKMPLLDTENRVVGTFGVSRDITERKRAEESLRESEERFRLMFFSNPLPMWVYNVESLRFLEVNEAAVMAYGYSKDEFLSMRITDIRPLEEQPRLLENLAQIRPDLQSSGEWQHRKKNGQIMGVQITSHTFQFGGAASRKDAILVVAEDITERKRAEEARLAREAADEANRAKSEFLSRMSHELRTPLNSILGFSELLQVANLSPKQHQYLNYIRKSGKHLLSLINEVLDIARIEAGHSGLSLEPVEVQEALRECLDLIQPMAAQQKVTIDVGDVLNQPRYVLADRQRLRQVMLNIMSNAVKYNKEEGKVTLSCEAVGEHLRIRVADTGPGIPQHNLPKLFTPFERLGAEQRGIEGTGLGLALSKNLVEAMNGIIGVESKEEEGSAFWIDLTIVDAPEEQFAHVLTGTLDDNPQPTGTHTILYIEDNLLNLKLIEGILENVAGIKLITAMRGTLGIEMARQQRPDLILLDVHLPDLNGSVVLQRLKEDPQTRSIPVVIISADASLSQTERLRAAGALDYLTKPISIQKLLKIINEVINADD